MAEPVQISRGALGTLAGSLVLCLMALAYLVGRQSAPWTSVGSTQVPNQTRELAQAEEAAPPGEEVDTETLRRPALPTKAPRETPTRWADGQPAQREAQSRSAGGQPAQTVSRTDPRPVRRLPPPDPVDTPSKAPAPVRAAPAPPTAPPEQTEVPVAEPRDQAGVQRYFQQIDQVLATGGSMGSIGDPNQFATQALQGSLNGDSSQFEALAASTKTTLNSIRRIDPPASCRDHHGMLVKQLQQGLELLEQVEQSTTSLDTSNLTAIAARGQAMQEEVLRFQELDRRLRSGL